MAETQHIVHLVGVDAGGSSTRAVVLDASGSCLGYARTASGNPTSAGADLAAANVVAAVRGALEAAGVDRADRAAVAMAGASTRSPSWLEHALVRTGIVGDASIEADLAAVYLSGSRARLGYAAIAGTGAIAARLRDHAIERVADGLGWLLGDDGSGFWIGRRVLRAVAAELDGRGASTLLTDAVLVQLGIDRSLCLDAHARLDPLGELVTAVYANRPVLLARFAIAAFEAAEAGDEIAEGIIEASAARIAATLESVIDGDAPVVLGGSVLAAQPRMRNAVTARLVARGIRSPVATVPDGVVGSAVLALERAGVAVGDETLAARIETTLATLR